MSSAWTIKSFASAGYPSFWASVVCASTPAGAAQQIDPNTIAVMVVFLMAVASAFDVNPKPVAGPAG
jgi:hypothetical protein